MEAKMMSGVANGAVREALAALATPKNPILARLQNCLTGNKMENVVCGYSRMHNRHNRS